MKCNDFTEIYTVLTCCLEQHISPRKTITALNIQWNLKSCGSGFCMLPSLASTPSSSHSFGKIFLFAVITGRRNILKLNLSLRDQFCSSFHSPRLPFQSGDHKNLDPCSKYKLLKKKLRPFPTSEQCLPELLMHTINQRISLL